MKPDPYDDVYPAWRRFSSAHPTPFLAAFAVVEFLGAPRVRALPSLYREEQGRQKLYCLDYQGHTRLHSGTEPAVQGVREPQYWLFGSRFTLDMWFRVLGYTEEEQVIHCLRYGTSRNTQPT